MDDRRPTTTRRDFLTGTAAAAALLAAHGRAGWAASQSDASAQAASTGRSPRLLSLRLACAAPLAEMWDFYGSRLGLPVLDETAESLTIGAGLSRLTFLAVGEEGEPFYHFAFNIPENKIRLARDWQRKRTPIVPPSEGLRDPGFPDDIVAFRHWNAHSVFFWDPAGNLVEYIARHDLPNAAPGAFGSDDILYASEIGLIVDDVDATAQELAETFGLEQYRSGSDAFRAIGDEHGLLLAMRRGRNLGFDEGRPAEVFPTAVSLGGVTTVRYRQEGLPYEIVGSSSV